MSELVAQLSEEIRNDQSLTDAEKATEIAALESDSYLDYLPETASYLTT